nr:hypothetical protein [Tanacetum cinerariifolium]
MIDIGTPCRETIFFMYNLVRVSVLSVSRESLVVPATNRVSLDPDTSCQNLDEWNTLIYGIHLLDLNEMHHSKQQNHRSLLAGRMNSIKIKLPRPFKPANETNNSFCTIEVERLATHKLLSGGGVVDLTGDEDPTNEDRDIGMGDSTEVLVSLGGGISQESNIGDSDNTGDGGTIVGGGIAEANLGYYFIVQQS